eukprot:TRINITY_DN9173_c0_g2_i2.p2 TRINITY_DN9173_c0_g2~~TRINITY_DN9173_c0_g2_i2.p2  ORF type:complete len:127 (-),score=44.65 TRINITY_DN9173_c0_g2_i2:171-497(-)
MCLILIYVFFFFSSRRRHTRCREVSWARRCVQETVSTQSTWGKLQQDALQLQTSQKKMQNDVTDEVARNIVPNLIKILDTANCSHPLIDKYLRKWDFVMEENLSLIHI